MFPDPTFCVYVATAVVAAFGSMLFLWWLGKNHFHGSSVFVYVMILLMGETLRSVVDSYGRWLSLYQHQGFIELSGGWLWTARLLVLLIALIAIVSHMTYRIIKGPEINRRRRGDDGRI